MNTIGELFGRDTLTEAYKAIYLMEVAGILFAVMGLFGVYSIQLAWRYWNGDDMRLC